VPSDVAATVQLRDS